MYLKSLELFGFKSFAQKTTLNFHPGVTAVVGPNGCGKSNVLDAIRWVLGEQSAKALRGGEMADVIFNGTDSRQAVGMAEVSLTFAECEKDLGVEWNEVRLTRRVYRDGKSEYLLNKTPCRLKDIHQLFMDTGIGRTAYSIMEQGKIDQILSSRPEDRRSVFEEAAGITKYKTQKKEALRKLEYTEANLMRITDIIKEVKRQIGSLQRQAGKARRYQALLQDLRTLDTHLSKRNYDDLDLSLRDTAQAIADLREQHDTRESEIESREGTLRDRRHEIDTVEQQIAAARGQIQELKNQIAAAESRIGFNRERTAEFGTLAERYALDIAAGEEKLRVQEHQIQETDAQLEQLVLSLQTEESRLAEESARAAEIRDRRQELTRTLDTLLQESNRSESSLIRCRAEMASAISQRQGSESRLAQIQEDIRRAEENRDRLSAAGTENRERLERSRQHLDSRREALRAAETALAEARKFQSQITSQLSDATRALAEKESKLEVLRQLNAEGEGFNEGTQAVLRGLDNPEFYRPAILGALATQIDVEPDFIAAIEAALGQTLQAIVVKDSTVAEAMLAALREQKLGRAALTSADWMPRPGTLQMEALPDGALCWALDRVKAPQPLLPFLTRLLGNVAITRTLDDALRLRREHDQLAIATLSGEIFSPEGVVHGGVSGETGSSVLHRKVQIGRLETEAVAASEEVDRLRAAVARAAADEEVATTHLGTVRQEVQDAQVATSTLEGQQSLLERELHETVGKLETLEWERNSISQTLQTALDCATSLEVQITDLSREIEDSGSRRQTLQSEATELAHREEGLTATLNELRVAVATSKGRRDALHRERQPMDDRLHELRELIAQRRQDIDNYETRIGVLAIESDELAARIASLAEEVAASEAEAARIAASRATLAHGLQALEGELRAARKELTELQEARNGHEIRHSQIELRLEHLAEHVRQRYQIDVREFVPDSYAFHCAIREQRKLRDRRQGAQSRQEPSTLAPPESVPEEETAPTEEVSVDEIVDAPVEHESVDWEFVAEIVRDMSEKLDSMGPVNLDAIQEYDELEERYKFLEEQYADLTNSKTELLGVISKINTTTRQLFSDTFEQVRTNFKEMFTELFGVGAKANLMLSDENDPLECGIEIIAKPPGKQLQSISLLSGGEKTMTAVALLFSIYMVKPSPFCVLDEMDAPLDESNINRFIRILDRFVAQSQFVVITHNKRTIAKADILYGVTMEEQGVSKLVGVKLTKREDAHTQSDLMGAGGGAGRPEDAPSIAESFGKPGHLHSETPSGSKLLTSS